MCPADLLNSWEGKVSQRVYHIACTLLIPKLGMDVTQNSRLDSVRLLFPTDEIFAFSHSYLLCPSSAKPIYQMWKKKKAKWTPWIQTDFTTEAGWGNRLHQKKKHFHVAHVVFLRPSQITIWVWELLSADTTSRFWLRPEAVGKFSWLKWQN